MEIKSKRLVLKKLTNEDLDFIYQMESDPLVYLYEADEKPGREEIDQKYGKRISRMEDAPDQFAIFLICTFPDEVPIGHVLIQLNWDEMREWEIGYGLHPDYWGNGYATEAATLVLRYCFENLNAHKVVAFCNANNTKSANVMERVGMTREGLLREARRWHDEWCDEYVYAILEREQGLLPRFE